MMNMHNLPCYPHQGGAVDLTMMTNDEVVAAMAAGSDPDYRQHASEQLIRHSYAVKGNYKTCGEGCPFYVPAHPFAHSDHHRACHTHRLQVVCVKQQQTPLQARRETHSPYLLRGNEECSIGRLGGHVWADTKAVVG